MAAGGPVRRLYGVLRVTRRRVREAAPYKGGRCLDGGGGKPPPYMGSSPGTDGPVCRPYGVQKRFHRFVGAGHFRGPPGALRFRRPPSSAPFGGTFPLEGGRLSGGHMGPPLQRGTNPVPSSVTASPCHLSLSLLSLRDISP